MKIRPYQCGDCQNLADLFYQTVHTINRRDYTPEQLQAWTPGSVDINAWEQSFLTHSTLIAEENGIIVGFGDLDADAGYLDRLYVHKDYQGHGIATAICDRLEQICCTDKVYTHASITAQPFFEKRGWRTLAAQEVIRSGVTLRNYKMEKAIFPAENTPTLETPRLILRKFTEADVGALFSLLRDRAVNTFLPWFPLDTMPGTQAFYEERYAAAYRQPRGYQYALCRKTDNIPLGYMGVTMTPAHDLGYGLAKACWGQGYATEAGHALLARLEADGLPYITATHDIHNPRSGRVLERLGLTYQYSYEKLVQPKNEHITFRLYQYNLDAQTDRVYRTYWAMSQVHFIETLQSGNMSHAFL